MSEKSTLEDALDSGVVTVERPGEEGEPVVIIDGFSLNPDSLLKRGREADYGDGGKHYPGQRAPAPSVYLRERMNLLQAVLTEVFGMDAGASLVESNFSIVTTPPDRLTAIQRVPHFDSTDPSYLALLHYLCGPEEGGTSFYRHRATGFETIDASRLDTYTGMLQSEVREFGLPKRQYFSGTDQQFERIGGVEARFNRMVLYRGYRLHSGDISRPELIGAPGAEPRLTVNTFLAAKG
ncbi:DUF6445 family protein [Henriciella sp. AS95]|uniref:DUF6445 family protein n=1 Tax=Henriciella sp. AS95 TaxID=3135782 RepID=UPI00316D6AB9